MKGSAPGRPGIPAAELAAGTELGAYRIELLIGRGGMGVVYRADDLALSRKVALKLLAPELAEDVGFRERFHRESRLAASLDHPAIIPIYDAGEAGGRLYIAMRLVDGTDLKRLLAEEHVVEPERALRLLEQVADALDAAHERGLIHRDVKPSNVLIDNRGHVYLADFGLSRRLDEQAPVPGGARSLGTVDYVAPEQIRGDELDGRADLYSLGCMLYECLAGRPPFARGSDTAVVFAHLQEDPPALPKLQAVIKTALAKEPGDRYQSGRELIAAARHALGIGRARRWRAVVAGVVVAAAALAFGLFMTRHGGSPTDPNADSLVRIDAARNAIVGTTPVGHGASGVAARDRYVWVTNEADRTVWRIDRATGGTLKIVVKGRPTGVAVGPTNVLVASSSEHTLTTIDPATGAANLSRRLAGQSQGVLRVASGPYVVRYADASPGVVADLQEGVKSGVAVHSVTVSRDYSTFLRAYQTFGGLAADGQAIWATGDVFGRSLFRIDATADHRAVETHPLPFIPGAVAAGGGLVWVASPVEDRVWTFDTSFGKIRLLGSVAVPRGVVGLAYASGAVWVASSIDRVVSRIDPRTGSITRIPTDGVPTAISADGSDVWVTTTRPAPVVPDAEIGIGVLADCQGAYGFRYELALAGAELPLLDRGGRPTGKAVTDGVTGVKIGGKQVHLAFGCTDGTATSALIEARRLVEQTGVRILIGPTTAPEQIGLMQYARRHPDVTFVDGSAGAQILSPPPNAFSFHLDLAESMAGLGTYAYRTLGWRRAVVIGDLDNAIANWTQAAGFAAEFCALGGKIVKRVWVPAGTQDFDKAVIPIPRSGVDGVVAVTGVNTLLAVYRAALESPTRLINGALSPEGFDPSLPGVQSGSWHTFGERGADYRADLKRRFPAIAAGSGRFDVSYHDAMSAILEAFLSVSGDLSGNGTRFRSALAAVTIHSPVGDIRDDGARQAIGANAIVSSPGGSVVRRVKGVEHTFGGYFTPGDPPPAATNPACTRRTPPPWAG